MRLLMALFVSLWAGSAFASGVAPVPWSLVEIAERGGFAALVHVLAITGARANVRVDKVFAWKNKAPSGTREVRLDQDVSYPPNATVVWMTYRDALAPKDVKVGETYVLVGGFSDRDFLGPATPDAKRRATLLEQADWRKAYAVTSDADATSDLSDPGLVAAAYDLLVSRKKIDDALVLAHASSTLVDHHVAKLAPDARSNFLVKLAERDYDFVKSRTQHALFEGDPAPEAVRLVRHPERFEIESLFRSIKGPVPAHVAPTVARVAEAYAALGELVERKLIDQMFAALPKASLPTAMYKVASHAHNQKNSSKRTRWDLAQHLGDAIATDPRAEFAPALEALAEALLADDAMSPVATDAVLGAAAKLPPKTALPNVARLRAKR